MSDQNVVELVVFKVADPEKGLAAARAIVEDASSFNNAILSSETYQSAPDPHMIAQRIIWTSLAAAKEAAGAMETFPHMGELMEVMSEQILFEHFYEQ